MERGARRRKKSKRITTTTTTLSGYTGEGIPSPPPRSSSSSTIGSSNTSIGSKILFRRRQSGGNENVLLVLDLESTYGVYVAPTVLGAYIYTWLRLARENRSPMRAYTYTHTHTFVSIIPATDFIRSSSPSPAILSVARVIIGIIVPSLFAPRIPKQHSQFFPPAQKTVKLLRDDSENVFSFRADIFPGRHNRNAATCRLR